MRNTSRLPGPLMVDLYELTMADAYLAEGIAGVPATFSLFTRRIPPGWGYLVSAGVADVLDHLAGLRFEPEDLRALDGLGVVSERTLDALSGLRFTGEVRAMPEGTMFTADEPVLEVTAPLIEAQLVESAIVNLVQLPVLATAKAARCVAAAGGRTLVDFALRRTHGGDAADRVARAAYLAGFAATSNVEAALRYGIPPAGTMAHSYVQVHGSDEAAFAAFLRHRPGPVVLLVDTFDTRAGILAAIRATEGAPDRLAGIRLDSGDLAALAREARRLLDTGGRPGTTVFASGGLDEHEIARLIDAGAPIDAFGVGTRLGVVADSPALDMAYKLVMFDGVPTCKRSTGKMTLPGAKQVWRLQEPVFGDVLGLREETAPDGGRPLLEVLMCRGRILRPQTLADARTRLDRERAALPARHAGLDADPLPRRISATLQRHHPLPGAARP